MELYPRGDRKKFKGISYVKLKAIPIYVGIVPNEFSFIELFPKGDRKKFKQIFYVKFKVSSSLLIPYVFEENYFYKIEGHF